jgi:hypothetical protein
MVGVALRDGGSAGPLSASASAGRRYSLSGSMFTVACPRRP